MTHSMNDSLSRLLLLLAAATALGATACTEEAAPASLVPEPAHFGDASIASIVLGDGCRDVAMDEFAVGATAHFRVLGVDSGLSYEVSDASLLEVSSLADGGGQVTFLAPGSATLTARSNEDGSLVARMDLHASTPDRIEWQVGAELIGATSGSGEVPSVAVGGRVPVIAHLYAGEEGLRGTGVLAVTSGPAEIRYGALTDSDWLVVAPEAAGRVTIEVSMGPGVSARYSVDAVAAEDIARLELRSEEEGFGGLDEEGEVLPDVPSVYAQAFLADGTPVLGAPVEWRLGGDALGSRGDVFQYELAPEGSATLEARIGDTSVSTPIRAAGAEGARVTTGDDLACSASGDVGGGLGMLALVMLALVALSRRRVLVA